MSEMMVRAIPVMSRMLAFSVLIFAGGPTVAMEESPSSIETHTDHMNPIMNELSFEEPLEKRAYTYVSEYKRLPVFNFGLGKRRADGAAGKGKRIQPYGFGLGRRSQSYGLDMHKRNDNHDYYPLRVDYIPYDYYESEHSRENNLDDLLEDKRSGRQYSFGLGKRAWNSAGSSDSVGTEKRPSDAMRQMFRFGIGKRMIEDEEASQ